MLCCQLLVQADVHVRDHPCLIASAKICRTVPLHLHSADECSLG